MDFYNARKFAMALVIGALAIAIVGAITAGESLVGNAIYFTAALLMTIAAIVVIVKFCRCKYCGKVIINGLMRTDYCPRCKRSLRSGLTKKQEKKDRR